MENSHIWCQKYWEYVSKRETRRFFLLRNQRHKQQRKNRQIGLHENLNCCPSEDNIITQRGPKATSGRVWARLVQCGWSSVSAFFNNNRAPGSTHVWNEVNGWWTVPWNLKINQSVNASAHQYPPSCSTSFGNLGKKTPKCNSLFSLFLTHMYKPLWGIVRGHCPPEEVWSPGMGPHTSAFQVQVLGSQHGATWTPDMATSSHQTSYTSSHGHTTTTTSLCMNLSSTVRSIKPPAAQKKRDNINRVKRHPT